MKSLLFSAPSQPYQPPTLSSRKLGESSSNATNKRSTRSSKSLAPDSASTRRGESLAKPEKLETPPKKRKRAPRVSSVTAADEESDEAPKSPRKRRKVVDDESDELSTAPPSPIIRPSTPNRIPSIELAPDSPLTIYDEIPAPPPVTNDMKKLIEKAKVVSKSSSNGKLNGDLEKGPVAGPSRIGKQKLNGSDVEEDGGSRKKEHGRQKAGKKRSPVPEEEEEEEQGRERGGDLVKEKGVGSTKGLKPKPNSKLADARKSNEETRHSKGSERRTASKGTKRDYISLLYPVC